MLEKERSDRKRHVHSKRDSGGQAGMKLFEDKALEAKAVNTIRMLAVDAVEKANSGHPGMPMGAADCAYVLWTEFMNFSPTHPDWTNRDRFILSAGHGSMLQYALLHLTGFDVSLEDIKNFRQWGSKTAGHPEVWLTPGVECTTGPLGQGFGNGVGMALASKMMADRFNTESFAPVDHYIYAIVSDGDLMEGVASEAASLAGHLELGNIIYIYDDNRITIDGDTSGTFSEDVAKRFEAYGWHTQRVDGHDRDQIRKALKAAQEEKRKPSLILARTHIGFGSPAKQDSADSHGSPLGGDEIRATKEALGWPLEPTFLVPEEVRKGFRELKQRKEEEFSTWTETYTKWRKENSERAKLWDCYWKKDLPENFKNELLKNLPKMPDATRGISGKLQQVVAKMVPGLVGGSADLASSNKTILKDSEFVTAANFAGRNIHFGIREHAMGAITNGMALYGSFIPYSATFLIFSDYFRPSIRLAALSKLQTLYLFTHDSFFLGEDGPTHQPIEQLASLRLIPNLRVFRPADSLESAAAWKLALEEKNGPSAFSLTRQNLPELERNEKNGIDSVLRGGYTLSEAHGGKPKMILVATGSEVHLAVAAQKHFENNGIPTRVVSMLCAEIFASQDADYRDRVLPRDETPTVVIEAARCDTWHRWVGPRSLMVGMNRFGESAPPEVLADKFGFTSEKVVQRITDWLREEKII